MNDDHLLNEIARILNKQCLSDLHSLSVDELSFVLEKMESCNYSIEDWNYVLTYILQKNVQLDSIHHVDVGALFA